MLLANWSFIHTTFHGHEIKREERKRRKGDPHCLFGKGSDNFHYLRSIFLSTRHSAWLDLECAEEEPNYLWKVSQLLRLRNFVRTINIHSQVLKLPGLYWTEAQHMHRPSSSGVHLGPQENWSGCERKTLVTFKNQFPSQ